MTVSCLCFLGHRDFGTLPKSEFLLGATSGILGNCGQRQTGCRREVRLVGALDGERAWIPFLPSCRKRGDKWIVAMNKWQDLTDMEVNQGESFLTGFLSNVTEGCCARIYLAAGEILQVGCLPQSFIRHAEASHYEANS
jgi:hypothetical protein